MRTARAAPLDTGLYVHLPFCTRRCVYCDFAVVTGREGQVDAYGDALVAELEAQAAATGGARLDTIYIGGGTPSKTPGLVSRVLAVARDRFALAPDAEITVEANPDSLDDAVLGRFVDAGVNRLSLGVQTFDDERLARLGRLHDAAAARAAVGRASERIARVSLDLIYGIPGTAPDAWADDIASAIALGVEHVSAYCLTVEPGTPLAEAIARGKAPPADEALEAAHLDVACAAFAAAGFERYEISNWARPGARSRHNVVYWRNGDCLGAGLGAAGYWGGVRWKNETDFARYLRRVGSGVHPAAASTERLPPVAALGETVFVGLRMADGVDLADASRRHGADAAAAFGDAIARHVADGLLRRDGDRVALTDRGMRFANRVLESFVVVPD